MFQQIVLGDHALWEDWWCLCLRSPPPLGLDENSFLYLIITLVCTFLARWIYTFDYICNVNHGSLFEYKSTLACAVVKSLNATSQAMNAIIEELEQIREAVLENCVAIDYLLLRRNHECEELKDSAASTCLIIHGSYSIKESK